MAVGDVQKGQTTGGNDVGERIAVAQDKLYQSRALLADAANKLAQLEGTHLTVESELGVAEHAASIARRDYTETNSELIAAINDALTTGGLGFDDALEATGHDPKEITELKEQYRLASERLRVGEDCVLRGDDDELVWGRLTAISPELRLYKQSPSEEIILDMRARITLPTIADEGSEAAEPVLKDVLVRADRLDAGVFDEKKLIQNAEGQALFPLFDKRRSFDEDAVVRFGKTLDALRFFGNDLEILHGTIERFSSELAQQIKIEFHEGRWELGACVLPSADMRLGGMPKLAEAIAALREYVPDGYNELRRRLSMVLALTQNGWPEVLGKNQRDVYWDEARAVNLAQAITGMTKPEERYLAAQQLLDEGRTEVAKVEADDK